MKSRPVLSNSSSVFDGLMQEMLYPDQNRGTLVSFVVIVVFFNAALGVFFTPVILIP